MKSLKELRGNNLKASDGPIGKVDDFYFDVEEWTLRYFVVDTGTWLPGRLVLLSPSVFRPAPSWGSGLLPVTLSKKQIKNSPSLDITRPVTREEEIALRDYYGWPSYWTGDNIFDQTSISVGLSPRAFGIAAHPSEPQQPGDPHLRSFREVTGYGIHATDGRIGHLDDIVVDEREWRVRYLIADTGSWLPGKKVALMPSRVKNVRWPESDVDVTLDKETIRHSPSFDDRHLEAFEACFIDYYRQLGRRAA